MAASDGREWDEAVDPPMAWLERANRQAITARLLAGTVHDVSNSLQVISGAAEMLAMDPTADAVSRRTGSIVGQAMSATGALQKLTAFVRDATVAPDRLSLRELAERALLLRHYPLRKLRIDARVDGEADGIGTTRSLLQVMLNLVINAEQALEQTEGAQLRIVASVEGDWARISVRDNGPGLASEAQQRMFRWPPHAEAGPATLGIGLLVSRALVAGDRGSLALESPPGGGLAVTVAIPRRRLSG